MKRFIAILLIFPYLQVLSQNMEVVDTIFKTTKNDFLVLKNKNLYSNRQMEFWTNYGEKYFSKPQFLIFKKQVTNKKGLINLESKTILLPFEYDNIYNTRDSGIVIVKNNSKGLFFPFENKLASANNQKVGYITYNGSYLLLRNDSLFFYNSKHQRLNLVNGVKDFIQNDNFNQIEIERNGRFGVMDYQGKIILPFEFSSISTLENGNFILGKNGEYNITRKSDLKKLNQKSFYTYTSDKDMIIASHDHKLFFYNQSGNLLATIEGILEQIPINEEGHYFYKYKELWGIVSYKGKIIKKPFLQDKKIITGNNKFFEGKINNQWKMFDYSGNLAKNIDVDNEIKSNF